MGGVVNDSNKSYVSPIDFSIIPELSANRLAYASEKGLTVEKSTDSGNTWVAYGENVGLRTSFLTGKGNYGYYAFIGSKGDYSKYMLRLTYDFTKINVSSLFIKIYILADIFGTGFKSYCTIQTDYNNTGVFKDYIKEFEIGIGRNIINVNKLYVSNSKSANPSYTQKLRFIFYSKGTDMQATLFCVKCIRAYGYNLYNYDKIILRTGVPYDIWDNQQCIFTNYIKAPHFEGDLQGTADNAKTVNSHTVEADVPSDAKFTDTTYDAVSTDDIQKWIDEEISIS